MAAQHALREDSPTWAFRLFGGLFADLADREVDDELVSRLFVDGGVGHFGLGLGIARAPGVGARRISGL